MLQRPLQTSGSVGGCYVWTPVSFFMQQETPIELGSSIFRIRETPAKNSWVAYCFAVRLTNYGGRVA